MVSGKPFGGSAYVNAVLDCADRECIGLNVSEGNDAREGGLGIGGRADSTISGICRRATPELVLRTDNSLVCASELSRARKVVRPAAPFILRPTPEQNGVAQSFTATLERI